MKASSIVAVLMAVAVFIASCQKKQKDFSVDLSNISADVELVRFDLDFDTISPRSVYSQLPALAERYGDFLDLYMRGIIGLPSVDEADFQMRFDDFMNYCKMNSVFRDVEKEFPADADLKALFSDAFRHYKYYFPDHQLPKVYTVISGFQESVFPTDDIMAFALEKYLGTDYPAYAGLGIENYKRRKMTKAMMPVDFFRTHAMLTYPKSDENADNVLNEMIYQGRIQYFLKSLMPQAPDSLLWGYSDYQFRWAEYYEENVWNYLIDKKLLFETKPLLIRNLTGEGPFTNAFGDQSAPGVASYCGYGIVCSFMDHHPEISLAALMEISDLQSIYNMSRYNP